MHIAQWTVLCTLYIVRVPIRCFSLEFVEYVAHTSFQVSVIYNLYNISQHNLSGVGNI